MNSFKSEARKGELTRVQNLLFISSNDEMGQRFSGIDWFSKLHNFGYEARMLIGREKKSHDPRVKYFKNLTPPVVQKAIRYLEIRMGQQSRFSPSYFELAFRKDWRNADLVHFQIVHDGSWFRIEDLPKLSKNKPTIWTWHDAWPITGHCIQPLDCKDFEKKCLTCTHLDWPMQLTKDTAFLERKRKANAVNKSKIHIHVASKWMGDLIKYSGNFKDLRVKIIPFGIDLTKFNRVSRDSARQKFGIQDNSFVIGIRASDWVVKNTNLFLEAIQDLNPSDRNVVVVTYEKIDAFWESPNVSDQISFKDLGWLEEAQLIDSYKCLDVFLGISSGESFGLMPIEAAACGAIPISLKRTAVAEFVSKIDETLTIDDDPSALRSLLEKMISNQALCLEFSTKMVSIINRDYDLEIFLERMANFYDEVIGSKK